MNGTPRYWILAGLGTLLLGAALGYLIAQRPQGAAATHATADGRRVLYWYDPMRPDQHFDRPGKSPFMDMELVPRYADASAAPEAAGGAAGSVLRIDPRIAQNLGMRYALVERAAHLKLQIVDRDPFEQPLEELSQIKVCETYLAGTSVWRA